MRVSTAVPLVALVTLGLGLTFPVQSAAPGPPGGTPVHADGADAGAKTPNAGRD